MSTKRQALEVLQIMAVNFPGLIDGETETDGADVIELLTVLIHTRSDLLVKLEAEVAGATEDDDE